MPEDPIDAVQNLIAPEDDSCIALVEALVEDAIVRQRERHAQEDYAKATAASKDPLPR